MTVNKSINTEVLLRVNFSYIEESRWLDEYLNLFLKFGSLDEYKKIENKISHWFHNLSKKMYYFSFYEGEKVFKRYSSRLSFYEEFREWIIAFPELDIYSLYFEKNSYFITIDKYNQVEEILLTTINKFIIKVNKILKESRKLVLLFLNTKPDFCKQILDYL